MDAIPSSGIQDQQSTWNFKQIGIALIVAAIAQYLLFQDYSGALVDAFGPSERKYALILDVLVLMRSLSAWVLKEKNKGWIFYICLLYSSPFWIELVFRLTARNN